MPARGKKGNLLILITCVIAGIVLLLLFFVLGYMRIVGSSMEQKTAIEAAALAAARDISRIVVEIPGIGFVGISDSAPNGSATAAADGFDLSVCSINTLIGTARLDLIIADRMDIPEWEELARADLARAVQAGTQLEAALDAAVTPGGMGVDKDGQRVSPYQSAEAAYVQNQIRLTGSSSYVPGSLSLEMGVLGEPTRTTIPLPNPTGADPSLNNSNTIGGFYSSYTNLPFKGEDFVFAGIGDSVTLVEHKRWRRSLDILPYQFRSIVRAQAVQELHDARSGDRQVQAVAAAQPASVFDPRPAPGALTISFPDGRPDGPESLNRPLDLYGANLSQGSDSSDYYFIQDGDFPIAINSRVQHDANWPITSDPNRLASSACKLAVYDWFKRAGTRANIDSLVGMHNTIFNPQGPDVPWPPSNPQGNIPDGIMHIYKFDRDGVVVYRSKPIKPYPWYCVSDRQALIECYEAITNGADAFSIQPVPLQIIPGLAIPAGKVEFTPQYDLFVRIYSRRLGKAVGGKHGGEPMDNDIVSYGSIEPLKLSLEGTRGSASYPSLSRWYIGAKTKSASTGIGIGAIPTLMPQDDFAFKWGIIASSSTASPNVDRAGGLYEKYDAAGSGLRQTYQRTGSVADIRFRRLVKATDPISGILAVFAGRQVGYVGEK
ncbi:MAG: hypothetical protein IPM23_04570 [Candidatus Melainabacteria bacterium]|nr:hypothetical protein [Candidatus Melainabacteria bacterium]